MTSWHYDNRQKAEVSRPYFFICRFEALFIDIQLKPCMSDRKLTYSLYRKQKIGLKSGKFLIKNSMFRHVIIGLSVLLNQQAFDALKEK